MNHLPTTDPAPESDRFLTIEAYESALSRISNPVHRTQFLLMGDAGLRVTEVCQLRWSAIDVRRKLVTVQSLKKRAASTEKTRRIPMSARLFEAFVELAAKRGKATGYVFGGTEPIGRGAINKWLNELTHRHPDLPHIHPHLLRHTFATNLRMQGAELEDIKDALGHEKLDTSLIYAHADREKLRQLIEASRPRPSVWTRLRTWLFPAPSATVNIAIARTPELVGREAEMRQLEKLLGQGINTVVVGEIGVGKSFLIDSLAYGSGSADRKVLEMDDTREFKRSLAGCLLHLLGSKEAVAQLIYGTDEPDALRVKVSKESIPNLCRLLMDSCTPKEYILKIGEIDSVTPTVVRALEQLKAHFVILTTSRGVKMSASSFLWDFEKVELKPLTRPDSLRLFHRLTDDLQLSGHSDGSLEWIRNKVYDTSEGNPRMITELVDRIRREPMIDAFTVDEICNSYLGRQTREIDVSPYLLLFFGGLIIFKYIGREANEQGLTFIGSAIMVIVMFGRYFFRGAKRKHI